MSLTAKSALLAVLAAACGYSAELTFQSTTMAQYWKEARIGQSDAVLSPLTQFVDVNVNNLGTENLSLYLYGWGQKHFGSTLSKSDGELVNGYLRYHFNKANGEILAGRIFVYEYGNVEQVDGLSARADLVGGLNVSAFAGKPCYDSLVKADKRDFLVGARVGTKLDSMGEMGISVLMDGPKPSVDIKNQKLPYPSRRLVSTDLHFVPTVNWDITARTSYHTELRELAEQDYAVRYRAHPLLSLTGQFIDRKYRSYFAATTLPMIFRQDTLDAQKSYIAKFQLGKMDGKYEFVGDYKHMVRDSLGNADRIGGELRLNHSKENTSIRYGLGYHRIIAGPSRMHPVVVTDPALPFYSLSHHELRAFTFADWGKYFGSLDAVYHRYDDKKNPNIAAGANLKWKADVLEIMASMGWRPKDSCVLSGDLIYGANPMFARELRAALRLEYRFGGTL